jgi:RNase H-fold protein (predicted Holliday junction resolvase)
MGQKGLQQTTIPNRCQNITDFVQSLSKAHKMSQNLSDERIKSLIYESALHQVAV